MPSDQASVGTNPNRCTYLTGYNPIPQRKAMGNHPCEKLPQENYNGEDTLHSNHWHSESKSKALVEDDYKKYVMRPSQNSPIHLPFLQIEETDFYIDSSIRPWWLSVQNFVQISQSVHIFLTLSTNFWSHFNQNQFQYKIYKYKISLYTFIGLWTRA